jgi:hypothetical protein
MNSLEDIIKIVLAILFFVCLLDVPYGYYQLVRFLALIGFGILSYKSYQRKENAITIVYAGLAILFQPLFKISLGRDLWNIIDVFVGIGLISSIFINPKGDRK